MSIDQGQVGSERRVVTVLFADIAGFTAMTEHLDPETVTDVMNDIFAMLGADVEAVGGHVDKVVGDEVMALFGAPVAHEDDALRAVRAAVGMHRGMDARAEVFRKVLRRAPRLRIGIHSGLVVWGAMGPPGQARFTVMGDVVNLAYRLQSAAPEGGILVSDAIYRQIRGVFLTKAWAPIAVRGKSEPVAVYEIVGERERAEAMHRPPFVDRQADLEHLQDFFARTRRGRAQVVVITGDPGVGKTRLVEEFITALPHDVALLQATCPPYGGQSLGPLTSLFRQFAGLTGSVTLKDVESRVPMGERTAQAAVILSRLFNLTEVPQDGDISHETALLVAAEAIRRMLTKPTVVWIEDLQWADTGTREILPQLVDHLNDTPLLLIANQRAGDEPLIWGKRTAASMMPLDPLNDADARALLIQLLGEELPQQIELTLLERAAGNPFYLSEIVATLSSTGILVKDDRGHWRVAGSVEQVLPDTIQAALLARVDRLGPDLRALIQRAAVVGNIFRRSLLAELSSDVDIKPLLAQLEDASLIRRLDLLAPDPEYVFVHPLFREVAYNSLLIKHQVALHRAIAEAMERLSPERAGDMAKALGTHFDLAGVPEKALPYLLQAGRSAYQRYATGEAVVLLERVRALAEVAGDVTAAIDASELLGELYERVQVKGARARAEVWQYVRAHIDPAKEPIRAARAAIKGAHALLLDGKRSETWQLLDEAQMLLPADHVLWSDLYGVRSLTLIVEARYQEALDAAVQAVEISNRLGGLHDRARAHNFLSHPTILPLLGDEGRRIIREWVREVEAAGDEWALVAASQSFTGDVWTRGIVDDDVLRLADVAIRKSSEHGWTHDEAKARVLLGWGQFLIGQWPEAEANLQWAQRVLEDSAGQLADVGWLILLPYARGNLAMARGRLDEAKDIFQDGLANVGFHAPIFLNHDLARCLLMLGHIEAAKEAMSASLAARDRLKCIICGCQANGIAAEFCAAVAEHEQARELAAQAEETAAKIGHVATLVRANRARARVALREGNAAVAMSAAEAAVERGLGLPLRQPYEHAQSLVVLGQACFASGEAVRAAEGWAEARKIFERQGALWHLHELEGMVVSGPARSGD